MRFHTLERPSKGSGRVRGIRLSRFLGAGASWLIQRPRGASCTQASAWDRRPWPCSTRPVVLQRRPSSSSAASEGRSATRRCRRARPDGCGPWRGTRAPWRVSKRPSFTHNGAEKASVTTETHRVLCLRAEPLDPRRVVFILPSGQPFDIVLKRFPGGGHRQTWLDQIRIASGFSKDDIAYSDSWAHFLRDVSCTREQRGPSIKNRRRLRASDPLPPPSPPAFLPLVSSASPSLCYAGSKGGVSLEECQQ